MQRRHAIAGRGIDIRVPRAPRALSQQGLHLSDVTGAGGVDQT